MTLVLGSNLPDNLRREVLNAYVNRWTFENCTARYAGHCVACVQHPAYGANAEWHDRHAPLVTDQQWLAAHAFNVTMRGTLNQRDTYAHSAAEVN